MPRDVARILVVASMACTAGAVALARVVVQESATSRPPTFNQEVAPILFGNCVSCHRPGDVAPMSLVSYEAARPWARAIKTKVLAGEMPPSRPCPTELRRPADRHRRSVVSAAGYVARPRRRGDPCREACSLNAPGRAAGAAEGMRAVSDTSA